MSQIQEYLAEVEALDAQINKLRASIAGQLNELQEKRNTANGQLEEAVLAQAQQQLSDKDYGCGTANIDIGTIKIKVVVRKDIKWDEDYIIKNIEPLIRQAGKDPEQFIKYKRSVSETSYKSFDDNMKKVFEPARTVKASKPSITYERKV